MYLSTPTLKMYRIVTIVLLMIIACFTGTMADCVYKGVSYPQGPIVTSDPCDHCICPESGKAACAIVDCFYPFIHQFCPDGTMPAHKEGFCCPVCNDTSTIQAL